MGSRILIAEDDASLRTVMGKALSNHGLQVSQTGDGGNAIKMLREDHYDVAIVDLKMPSLTGLEVLSQVSNLDDPPHVIIITAQNTMLNAIQAMKGGAYEYLCKPFDIDLFEDLVMRAVRDREQVSTPPTVLEDRGVASAPDSRTLYGHSKAMQSVFKCIGRAADSPHSVLVTGESGTGKELVARILHQESRRATGPFVAVNTAAIPGELLEADLFGHVKGAFTGAHAATQGKFLAASGGTLFLDEVGEMPLALQAKLLRVLEQKSFYPLGADKEVEVDVRIITATHRDLAEDVRGGNFRSDLFFRLNVLTIHLPALRDRIDDIPPLARWLLRKHVANGSISERSLSDDAIDWLCHYSWPGNVRELENVLVRAATYAQGPSLHVDDLVGPTGRLSMRRTGAQEESFEATLEKRLRPVVRTYPEPAGDEKSDLFELVVGTSERVILELVMKRMDGNQLRAAALLGINRNTLRRKLAAHSIAADSFRGRNRSAARN
jgi:two-component system nitrogen regulation response regulator GlnG